jgi:hypothetical protein
MRHRILAYAIPLVLVATLAGIIVLSRVNTQARGQSLETKRVPQWEYCFVSSPYSYEKANHFVVNVSYGGASQMAETDVTGVSALNKLGAEGWELLGFNTIPGQTPATTYVFKRPKM